MNQQTVIPSIDPGNQLLGIVPANLTTDIMDTPAGQRMVVTIRTPSSTTTVFLDRADANSWADNLRDQAAQMTGLTIVRGPVPADLNGAIGAM